MTADAVFAKIAELLRTEFSVPAERIAPETRLADLDLDSIGLVELAAALEDEFDVDFTGSVITMEDRIGDLADRLTTELPAP